VAHEREDLQNNRVAYRVEDLVSDFVVGDELLRAKHRQVLRNIRLLHSKLFHEVARAKLSAAEQFDDCDSRRVSECLEHIGLKAPQRIRHN